MRFNIPTEMYMLKACTCIYANPYLTVQLHFTVQLIEQLKSPLTSTTLNTVTRSSTVLLLSVCCTTHTGPEALCTVCFVRPDLCGG